MTDIINRNDVLIYLYFSQTFKFYSHVFTCISFGFQDVSDLFGADLPTEGGSGGQFTWRDGPLLRALQSGHWVVFDEVSELHIQLPTE